MKPKRLKQYATGTVVSPGSFSVTELLQGATATPATPATTAGKIATGTVVKSNNLSKEADAARKTLKKSRTTNTAKVTSYTTPITEATTTTNNSQLTAEELEALRSLIDAGAGTGQNTNPVTYEDPVLSGNGGTVVDTVETTDDDTEPSTGSGSENQTTAQKVIAWAKANALYLGIAAAVLIYIMYKRKK